MEKELEYADYLKIILTLELNVNLFGEEKDECIENFRKKNYTFDIVEVEQTGKCYILFPKMLSIGIDKDIASHIANIAPVKEFYLFSYDRKMTPVGNFLDIFYESNFVSKPDFIFVGNQLENISILQGKLPILEELIELKFRIINPALLDSMLFGFGSKTKTAFFKKKTNELEPFELFQVSLESSENENQPILVILTKKYETAESFSQDHSFLLNLKRYFKASYDCNLALLQ